MMKKNLKFGRYLIKNVPYVEVEDGEYIHTIDTGFALFDIVEYMDKHELTTYDYEDWEKNK